MKKVLIIGSGGREHALGWKISQSPEVDEVIYAPGNAGTQFENKGRNVNIYPTEKERILDLINSENIDLTIVGPEEPLSNGLVDFLNNNGYNHVFGPTKKAARLESDKFFSFELMDFLRIPQAESVCCYNPEYAKAEIVRRETDNGIVIKARGLTGGKGVLVCDSKEQALAEIENHAKKYGPHILIAERLIGEEFSVFGVSNGDKVFPLEISVQDHKRLLDCDKGPNTGGMGAYCPAPFGDPECQPTMIMLKSDLYKIIFQTLNGKEPQIEFNSGSSCCVILASQGYPGDYQKGFSISGLEEVSKIPNVKIFHSETRVIESKIVSNSGRILGVTTYSLNGILEAQELAYEIIPKLNIPGGFCYRKDIASKAIKCT